MNNNKFQSMSSKWWKFHVDLTEESLLKYRLKMLGMALKKLYRITLTFASYVHLICQKYRA